MKEQHIDNALLDEESYISEDLPFEPNWPRWWLVTAGVILLLAFAAEHGLAAYHAHIMSKATEVWNAQQRALIQQGIDDEWRTVPDMDFSPSVSTGGHVFRNNLICAQQPNGSTVCRML